MNTDRAKETGESSAVTRQAAKPDNEMVPLSMEIAKMMGHNHTVLGSDGKRYAKTEPAPTC